MSYEIDRLRLLEVLSLGEHVGREQQVDLAVGRLVAGAHHGLGCEASERAERSSGVLAVPMTVTRSRPPMSSGKFSSRYSHRLAVRREDGDLLRAEPPQEASRSSCSLGSSWPRAAEVVADRSEQRAVARDGVAVVGLEVRGGTSVQVFE